MIFGKLNPEKNLTRNVTDLSISPVRRSRFILGNPEKSFSTVLFRYNSDYLSYLRMKTVIYLPTPPENVAILTCEIMWIAKLFFIWMKVCCVLSNIGGSEKSHLWIVVGGSDTISLWCVATGTLGKQCHSKCSEWPPSALIHACSLFRHWSVA